jgi:hypothetical protein
MILGSPSKFSHNSGSESKLEAGILASIRYIVIKNKNRKESKNSKYVTNVNKYMIMIDEVVSVILMALWPLE